MSHAPLIKPTHKAITAYYATLQDLAAQNVSHEMGLRGAFQHLLTETAKLHDWTLIPEDSTKTPTGIVRPDATLKDKNMLPRGCWEAKDSNDSLPKEIAKKKAKGYSLSNTIFEDTRTALLYQNGKLAFEADLSKPQTLADLLNQFFAHIEPNIVDFEEAVTDFKDRVPDLAKGLVTIIDKAHKQNPKFKTAFADFFTLCQTALNPNIAQSAVDEMLVQHILTERLFRTIFNAADFTQRNVIAAEVEKVITALASQSFSRAEYLNGLDRFYLAIENAAKLLEWTEKQHFLNVVYERFFQGYSTKTADTMGIVYTPQPIVDFMCASVVEVLKKEFGKELGDPDVFVLDPCTGTGNFIVNLLKRIPPKKITKAYANSLFANEIMLLPYYIAALNIEHAYYELTAKYEPFEGLCFVDTLDIAEHKQAGFDFFTQKNSERVERQKKTPITVVVGNPPYNANQQNENDNNKNRRYDVVDNRIKLTYAKDSIATLKNQLYDPYVKFFRWATDRIGSREGIVCLVSNNSFLEQHAFDGMRKHLVRDYSAIYHIDLEGNVRHDPTLAGSKYNVFGIQVGVGITIAIKRQRASKAGEIRFHRVPKLWTREEKLRWLGAILNVHAINWETLRSDKNGNWINPKMKSNFASFTPIASKEAKANAKSTETLFVLYTNGMKSNRDETVYDFSSFAIAKRIKEVTDLFNAEVDRFKRLGKGKNLDDFIDYSKLKWSSGLKSQLIRGKYAVYEDAQIRYSLYRPFTKQALYYDRTLIDRPGLFRQIFPTLQSERENQLICLAAIATERPVYAVITDAIPNLAMVGFGGACQCFPFYIYNEDGSNRRENITDWALTQFRSHYKDQKISKWDIFHYVYGILHHPEYRSKFADNLKRELPRIPFAPPHIAPGLPGVTPRSQKTAAKSPPDPASGFWAFAKAGKALADLHLHYESAKEFPLTEILTPGMPRSPRVDSKMKLSKDKSTLTVNDSLTLAGIPPETFSYKLGNRSALDWIIDQYQLYTDPRTHITSDPNAWGDEHNNPEYIPQLLAKIITVSLETQKLIAALPPDFTESSLP
jgi:predicted helicase